uniref:Uncharacterized protein n=1 Tax=Ananas comosus var. bracteatus TaxID=296719 RepID=A0A6V7QEN3_ANACO|nr:unnamed protein product [Ananas comosus var. bracteatus]
MGSCFSSPSAGAVMGSVHRDSFRKMAADFVQRPRSAAGIGEKDFRDLLKTYSRGERGFNRKKELMRQCSSRHLTILLLRLLIAAEIRTLRDDYPIDFFPLYGSLEEFCSDRVLPIGSNHLHADILSRSLGVPIRVIDIRGISDSFPKKSSHSKRQFEIILLYRPDGHYDILYPSLSDREILYAVVDREYTSCCGLSAWLFKAMYTFD